MSTLHSRDAAGTVTVLHNASLAFHEIASTLKVAVAQRLVRPLCADCRRQGWPTEDAARWLRSLGADVPDVTWHAKGCDACRCTGYRGRTGPFEVWALDEEDRALLMEKPDERTVRRHLAEKEDHACLIDRALERAAEGVTSLAELSRAGGLVPGRTALPYHGARPGNVRPVGLLRGFPQGSGAPMSASGGRRRLMTRRWFVCAALAWAVLAAPAWAKEPWPKAIEGHVPPGPGEHPRLLFRESDLPMLKARAETPEGEAMLTRLRAILNGGDGKTMPKDMGAGPGNGNGFASPLAPGGVFTISHVAGYGFLYQITGDTAYADLGRKAMDAALAGHRGSDKRYSFKNPSGALRAGPSLGWYAVGYDLCYDGWDEDYRLKIGKAIANYNEGNNMSLPELVRGSRHSPRSNHWGMQVGGGAMALLAVLGDPGLDQSKLEPLLEVSQKSMIRNLTEGFGDGGYFTEGDGTGSMSSHIIFLQALDAWRNVRGKDFITPRPNAQWTSLRWMLGTVVKDGKPHFHSRDGYPHNVWDRDGLSGGGYFGTGFAVATPPQAAAWRWFYDTFFKQHDLKLGVPYDTIGPYPHQSVMAFVHWPFGLEPVNPAHCIPRASVDHKFSYCLFRNEWEDAEDIVITVLGKRPRGHTKDKEIGPLWITAYGKDETWGAMKGDITHFEVMQDGCASVATSDSTCLAVDWTPHSGAEGMLVMTGPGAGKGPTVEAGGTTYHFKFFTKGTAPTPKAQGDAVVIGKQTVTLKDGHLVLGQTSGPWTGPTEKAMKAVKAWKQ